MEELLNNYGRYKVIKDAFTLSSKPNGNLRDYLKLCDDKFVNNVDEEFVSKIEEEYKRYLLNGATILDYKVIDEVVKNGYSKSYTGQLILAGILYKHNDKYYIPNDIIEYYKNNISNEIKSKNCLDNLNHLLITDSIIYGYFCLDDYKNPYYNIYDYREDYFHIIEVNSKKYMVFDCLNKDDVIPYIDTEKLEIETMEKFCYVSEAYSEISKIIDICLNEGDNTFEVLVDIVSNFRYPCDGADFLTQKYHIHSEDLEDMLFNIADEIRYWCYGGRTKPEVDMEEFVLPSKPKSNTLSSLLMSLSNNAKEYLCNNYEKKEFKDVEEILLAYFRYELDELKYAWDNEFFYKYDGSIYDRDVIDVFDVLDGLVFLYKDGKDYRIVFPKEIIDIASNANSEENKLERTKMLAIRLTASQILYLHGIVDRNSFYEDAKKKNLVDDIDELDKAVSSVGKVVGDKYTVNYKLDKKILDLMWEEKQSCKFTKSTFGVNPNLENMDDSITEKIDAILDGIDLSFENKDLIISTVIVALHTYVYRKEVLDGINREISYNLSKSIVDKIDKVCKHYKDIMPIWMFNGYSQNEMCEILKSKKVGRNDPCPCGSGKKYKKCCGS